MKEVYQIAGKIIEINSVHEAIHTLCKAYRHDGNADFSVCITQADIQAERIKSYLEDEKQERSHHDFPDSYLETLAVYRKIAERMIDEDTILFHGSAVAVDGFCYLFTAGSGTGKSTHTRLWREVFGSRAVMVNDDKPLIQFTADRILVYGTPWDGKHHLSQNISVPLKAICILTRAEENHIEEIAESTAFPLLLQQCYRPQGAEHMHRTLYLLNQLQKRIPIYHAGCNMEREAAELTYQIMKG